MKNPFNHPAWIDISIFLARLTLGAYMLIAGWNKMASDKGLSGFVEGMLKLRPEWLPESFTRPYGYALPILELLTGLALILGLFTRVAAGILTLLLLSIAIAVVSKFGIHGTTPEKAAGPFHHSIVMIPLSFLLAIVGSGRLALDPLYFGGGEPDAGGGKK